MRKFLAPILLMLAAAGCGQSHGAACVPVHGQVLRQGQPLAEAMVAFHPLSDQAGSETISGPAANEPRPVAYTDQQGRYALTTIAPGDGAPPGRYAITVELREPRLLGEETIRDGRNMLPPQYANPKTTPIRFSVTEERNEVAAIDIE